MVQKTGAGQFRKRDSVPPLSQPIETQANTFSSSRNSLKHYRHFSNLGAASLVGAARGLYLWVNFTHDEQKRETGPLSGEALIDSLVVNAAVKLATGRGRPLANDARGRFWHGGNSFPLDHAAAAWSVAGAVAHKYAGPLTKLLAYGLASAVSAWPVKGNDQFPSDGPRG